ncbi:MAG: arsenite methyltransferase [Bacteroidetes bacterium]|nr:arsenite methyltransferase [Bacteroidota bacterium]
MKNAEDLKNLVREKYAEIALQDKAENAASCCGAGGCSTEVYNIMTDDYGSLEGYEPEADLALGCGLPTQFAGIKKGDTVVDLGSGAGNDCFVARHETGDTGKVIGVDFTPAMIEKARSNVAKLGYSNVEFRLGDIEKLPISADTADVVVSNCVLNLVPDKEKAFAEMYRVLKPGGHFSISDVVLIGELPSGLKNAAEMYAGCVSGAIQKDRYLNLLFMAGFQKLAIQKEKEIQIPADILANYLTPSEIQQYRESGKGIFSVTVYGEKPAQCCAPGSGCC